VHTSKAAARTTRVLAILGSAVMCGLCSTGVALAAAPETPETKAATGITATTAVLNGVLNPHSEAVVGYDFNYNTNGTCSEGATSEPVAEAPFKEADVFAEITGLEPNREYTFCLVATHLEGETLESSPGSARSLKTLGEAPAVDSETTTNLSSTGATLVAQIDANNEATTYAFAYSEAASGEALDEPKSVPGSSEPLAALYNDQTASVELHGLRPRTSYYYQVTATNGTGTTVGPVEPLQTLATPIATTGEAAYVTSTTALFSGTVNPGGLSTGYHFAYVDQASYEAGLLADPANPYAGGSTTSESASVGADYAAHAVTPLLVGELRPGVTYHYALVATNSLGATIGADATFTTSPSAPGNTTVSGGGTSGTAEPVSAVVPAIAGVPLVAFPSVTLAEIASRVAQESSTSRGSTTLTTAQKLAKALKACGKRPRSKRAACRRQARRRYR
jgi:trimeric autotransporter adhesin